ncbi:MAG: hypothetical protein HY699_12220 [Deltaproteobacteria bacterium]|nr:hypothetical protein [Deltaproteobacteria bacterium]
MARSKWLAVLTLAAMLGATAVMVSAECTAEMKAKMRRGKMSAAEIEAACGADDDDGEEPVRKHRKPRRAARDEDADWPDEPSYRHPGQQGQAVASTCITSVGSCPMVVAGPAGYPCTCVTPFGPVYGTAR